MRLTAKKSIIRLTSSVCLLSCLALVNCGVKETTLDHTTHFFLKYGTNREDIGKLDTSKVKGFALDRHLFTPYVDFNYERVSFLDIHNQRILQFSYQGELLWSASLPNTNSAAFQDNKGASFQHIVCNEDLDILFATTKPDKKLATCTLWHIGDDNKPARKLKTLSVSNRFDDYASHRVIHASRVQNVLALDDEQTGVVWETLHHIDPKYRSGIDESRRVYTSRIDIVNNENQTTRTIQLADSIFSNYAPENCDFLRISEVHPDPAANALFLVASYQPRDATRANETRLFRWSLNKPALSRNTLEAFDLPFENWISFLGKSRENRLFLLSKVESKKKVTRAIIGVYDPEQKKTRTFAIENNPARFMMDTFYFSNTGRIFSFELKLDGVRIISWD